MSDCYSIHDLVRLRIAGVTPESEVVRFWLSDFRTDLGRFPPDIDWDPAPSSAPPSPGANPILQELGPAEPTTYVQVTDDGRWLCSGPDHDLYMMLQEALLRREASLLHAAGLVYQKQGVFVFGCGGAGKTAVALAVYKDESIEVLSDDLTVVRSDGVLLRFATPAAIYPHHHALLPGPVRLRLRGTRAQTFGLALARRMPLGHQLGRAARRWLIRRGGRASVVARSVRPGYVALPQAELFPPDRRIESISPALGIHLVRHGTTHRVDEIRPSEAAKLAIATLYYELKFGRTVMKYALGSVIDLEKHWERVFDVMRSFFDAVPRTIRVVVPARATPSQVQKLVVEFIRDALPESIEATEVMDHADSPRQTRIG